MRYRDAVFCTRCGISRGLTFHPMIFCFHPPSCPKFSKNIFHMEILTLYASAFKLKLVDLHTDAKSEWAWSKYCFGVYLISLLRMRRTTLAYISLTAQPIEPKFAVWGKWTLQNTMHVLY